MITGDSSLQSFVISGVDEVPLGAPARSRWKRALRIAPLVALALVIVVVGLELARISGDDPPPPPSASVPTVSPEPTPEDRELDAPLAGEDASALLKAKVHTLDADGKAALMELSGSVDPRAVTVVNLWATWCGPCREEFPLLRETLEAAGEGVRFVPLLARDNVHIEDAKRSYDALDAPTPDAFVADLGGLSGPLAALGVVEPGAELAVPVTLVFDCQRRLRWQRTQALGPDDLESLAVLLRDLQGDIGTDLCRTKRRKRPRQPLGRADVSDFLNIDDDDADEPTPPALKRTRPPRREESDRSKRDLCTVDGRCDAAAGETPINCSFDCRPSL